MEDCLRQLSKIKVSEIMIKDPLYTFPNEKISATELLMIRKNIGGLPIVKDRKDNRLIGIITQRDIRLARFAMSLDSPNTLVKDLMTPEPFVVKEDVDLNVKIITTHGGIVGQDGSTHNALEDLSLMASLPNLTVLVPSDNIELIRILEFIMTRGRI